MTTMTTAPPVHDKDTPTTSFELTDMEQEQLESALESLDFSDLELKYFGQSEQTSSSSSSSSSSSLDSVIVIGNLPIVDDAKEDKLVSVLKKIFKNVGSVKEGGVFMPKDEKTGKSKGFLFMEFETAKMAALAVKQGDGYRLDKSHVLAVHFFDDIEKYAKMEDLYVPPELEDFVPKEHLKGWLADEKARDQFVVFKGDTVGIYYNNRAEKPDMDHSRANWTDSHVSFSPQGLYLATVHKQGIALWGGPSWAKLVRFAHPNVKLFDFSPKEKYLTTWSVEPFDSPQGEKHNVCVWDIVSGQLLRSFFVPSETKAGKGAHPSTVNVDWPLFKWSFDDKYLAKMVQGPEGMIQVYETPGMGLLDKKSIKVENVTDLAWSPKDHILSYWTPESGNIPARVTLMAIPSREIIRTKNLFGVTDCKLCWQSNGDYFLVKVDRAKTKKQITTSFELYRIREKDVPVDTLESASTEDITGIYWEPKGTKFVVLTQEGQKQTAHFYQVQDAQPPQKGALPTDLLGVIQCVKSVEAKGVNFVSWSPKGRFCLLMGLRSPGGALQFWDTEEYTLLSTEEHYSCTHVEWDPTGRYVTTCVSGWHVQTDTGFMMWTFTGNLIVRQIIPGFKQFLWRPRPASLLSDEERARIRKSLKDYSREFDVEDAAQSRKASREVVDRREKQLKEWREYQSRWAEKYESEREERIALYGFDPREALLESDDWVEIQVTE